jgi:hypothetical protein
VGKNNGRNPGVDISSHTPGTPRGEELVKRKGREAGRDDPTRAWRTARDSTSINASDRDPIDPRMPYLPPA